MKTYGFGRTAPGARMRPIFNWRLRRRGFAALAWPMLPLAAILLLAPAGAFAADEAHTIVQKGRAFRPTEVTINRGESLTFTNNDEFIHQIYAQGAGFSFDTDEKNPGENITETFTTTGTFEVRCHIHPKMKLTVHVK